MRGILRFRDVPLRSERFGIESFSQGEILGFYGAVIGRKNCIEGSEYLLIRGLVIPLRFILALFVFLEDDGL